MNVVFAANAFTPQQTNQFYAPGVGSYGYAGTFARSSWVMPKCTLRGLSFQVTSYSAGSSVGVIIMKNGVNTPMQLVTAGGATGWFENVSDEVSFEAGDTCVIRGQAGVFATLNNFTLGHFIDGAGPFPVRYSSGPSVTWTGAVQYLSPFNNTSTLEGSPVPYLQYAPTVTGVVTDISLDLNANSRSTTSSWFLNVNGVDVGTGVVVPAGATGRFDFTDPPHPISVGDAYCFAVRGTSGGSLRTNGIRHTYVVEGPDAEYLGSPGQTTSSAASRYGGVFTPNNWRDDPAQSGQRVPFDLVVKGFRILSGNSGAGEATITLQKNGVDTGLVATKPAGFVGELPATGSPVSFSEGDRATYRLSPHSGVLRIDKLTTVVSNGGPPPVVVGDGPVPGYAWTPPTGTGTGRVEGAGPLPALAYAPPLGVPSTAHGGPIPSYAYAAPTGTGSAMKEATGLIPGVHWFPPEYNSVMTSQMADTVLADVNVKLHTSQMANTVLGQLNINARVTQMGMLVLARGAEPPLVPNPFVKQDGGQSPILDQRLVNMYVEKTDDGPATDARFGRPGLVSVAQLGPGPVRATFLHKGFRYTVSGDTVWRDHTYIGSVPAEGELRWAVSDEEIVVVAGRRAYYVTMDDVTRIIDPDLPYVRDVKYLAGRFVYFDDDTSGFYRYSALNDARNIDGLAFASAELNPDPIVGAEVQGEMLAIFGTLTTEWHYPTTDPSNPFKRSSGRTYDKGCRAIQTVQKADNTLYFVGHDRMVYRAAAAPQKVSTHDVDNSLRKQTEKEFEANSAFRISFGGHTFYVLNIVGQGTWAYDIAYDSWAEWKSWNKDRFRVTVADEDGFMGDYYTGSVFGFDGKSYSDIGEPIERVVSTFVPLTKGTMKNFNLALYTVQGVGNIPPGPDEQPVVEMRFSDHLGLDYTAWMEAPLGRHQIRGREALAVWTSLGAFNAPGRIFEFRCTDFVEFSPYAAAFNEARL